MKPALVGLGLGLLPIVACARSPEPVDCERLLDHVVELELGAAKGTTAEARETRAAQKQKVTGYVGADFVATCLKDLPYAQLECGLAASSLEALARCDEG